MLRSLSVPGRFGEDNTIEFPIPSDRTGGTVTVLCGPNGSGKSHALTKIYSGIKSLETEVVPDKWVVEVSNSENLTVRWNPNHKASMSAIGHLSPNAARRFANNDVNFLRNIVFRYLLQHTLNVPDQLADLFSNFDPKMWNECSKYRSEFFKKIHSDENYVFWIDSRPVAFLKAFCDLTSAKIGYRMVDSGLQLVMAFSNGIISAHTNWSDGYKSLFHTFASVGILKPDIYLLDEIENFLHPESISAILAFLKRHVPQSVISSHHPHLIFSNLVDEVYYIEIVDDGSGAEPDAWVGLSQQPSPPRAVTRMKTNIQKLTTAYQLFDFNDATMWETSRSVSRSVDLATYGAVLKLFGCEAVGAKPGVFPDRQSRAIAEFLESGDASDAKILDWGAGLGRVLQELSKVGSPLKVGDTDWHLFDNNEAVVDELRERFRQSAESVTISASRSDIPQKSFGVALLTNVLHALDPDGWIAAIEDCWGALSKNGILVITEIFPLLAPEKDAVPIPPHCLVNLLRRLSMTAHIRSFSVGGANSYCIAARMTASSKDSPKNLRTELHQFFEEMKEELILSYQGLPSVVDAKTHNEVLNYSFGIATLASYTSDHTSEVKYSGRSG